MKVPKSVLKEICRRWMLSDWMQEQVNRFLPPGSPGFSAQEAEHFGHYMEEAPDSHRLPKMPDHLIHKLGLANGLLRPSAEIERMEHRFTPNILKWNCNGKFGPSVMLQFTEEAPDLVEQFGIVYATFGGAFHFGYGRLYGEILADRGYITGIFCTALRGDEVYSFGADTSVAENRRLGTNPITILLPTKTHLGYNVGLDAATSPISKGGLSLRCARGESLGPGVVDDEGNLTTDPQAGKWLLHTDHKLSALATIIEGLAGLAGGGFPEKRCVRVGDTPGAPSQWFACVIHPDAIAMLGGTLKNMADVMHHIVEDNGSARLPGSHSGSVIPTSSVSLDTHAYNYLQTMAKQAGVELDWESFPTAEM